jgi:hypothetical protein
LFSNSSLGSRQSAVDRPGPSSQNISLFALRGCFFGATFFGRGPFFFVTHTAASFLWLFFLAHGPGFSHCPRQGLPPPPRALLYRIAWQHRSNPV